MDAPEAPNAAAGKAVSGKKPKVAPRRSARLERTQSNPVLPTSAPIVSQAPSTIRPSSSDATSEGEVPGELGSADKASSSKVSEYSTLTGKEPAFAHAAFSSGTNSQAPVDSESEDEDATSEDLNEGTLGRETTNNTTRASVSTESKAELSPPQSTTSNEPSHTSSDSNSLATGKGPLRAPKGKGKRITEERNSDLEASYLVSDLSNQNEAPLSPSPTLLRRYHQLKSARANYELIDDEILDLPYLKSVVLEYLLKKGYTKSEAMFRMESTAQEADARPIQPSVEDPTAAKYSNGFMLMREWIEENCLDIYKADVRRVQWPVFVYSFLKLVTNYRPSESRAYFTAFKESFEAEWPDDLRALEPIALPEHVESNETAKLYLNNRYRLSMNEMAFNNLIIFLESKEKEGTRHMVQILTQNCRVITGQRSAENESGLARLLNRAKAIEDFPAEDEGIPGHHPGSANADTKAGPHVLQRLQLGPLPMEPELMGDVRGELEEEDAKNPPPEGQSSLVQHFEQQIKREESEDAPTRAQIPLPASTARDVAMEVQKIKENRDRFKVEGRTGGVGPGVSVVMFTFHNTFDGITCVDFSQDNTFIAVGTDQHYIRVWTVNGEALPAAQGSNTTESRPSASRRLIGHSQTVYNVSFAPAATASSASNSSGASTTSKHLLSCSGDKTVRLWSLESWTCLVVYQGHDAIIWDVMWGPFGHYFVTGSGDRTARLWATNDPSFLRMFVGHEKDVDVTCFHPNNAYIFTGSCDRTVRMWKVVNADPVRMFTGHAGNITSMACSPNGKILASADDNGTIILWDLAPGKLLKRMRGHGKGGIWSLSWSVESTVLVSGGMDGTVRVWDVAVPNDANGQGRVVAEGGAGQKIDANPQAQATAAAGSKKKAKEVVVTSDQISAFPTKKSPVYKVHFTRQNLVMASGAYLPQS